jgi:hypothetical protein
MRESQTNRHMVVKIWSCFREVLYINTKIILALLEMFKANETFFLCRGLLLWEKWFPSQYFQEDFLLVTKIFYKIDLLTGFIHIGENRQKKHQ